MEIGLSIGSNTGDRAAQLGAARDRIIALPGVELTAQSAIYETDPVGVKPEFAHMKFLNAVLVIESSVDLKALHKQLDGIETKLGRVRSTDRFAPRSIDIDILFAGDQLVGDSDLKVPHPRWSQRRFVLQPLADLRPQLVLPGAKRTVREILASLPAGENVALYAADW